jgi:translation initiation factor IF-1
MVKNTTGGSKQKSIARKSTQVEHASRDPTPSNEFEFIAKVDKMLGNGMCHVIDIATKTQYLCHIRGKFRGKRKSHNFITTASFVLVAERPWQSRDKKECDLITILNNTYGDFDADNANSEKNNEIVFTTEEDDEDDDFKISFDKSDKKGETEDVVDFDDI